MNYFCIEFFHQRLAFKYDFRTFINDSIFGTTNWPDYKCLNCFYFYRDDFIEYIDKHTCKK